MDASSQIQDFPVLAFFKALSICHSVVCDNNDTLDDLYTETPTY